MARPSGGRARGPARGAGLAGHPRGGRAGLAPGRRPVAVLAAEGAPRRGHGLGPAPPRPARRRRPGGAAGRGPRLRRRPGVAAERLRRGPLPPGAEPRAEPGAEPGAERRRRRAGGTGGTGSPGAPPVRAAALFRLGMLARTQGDLGRARAAAEESLRLARAGGDDERTAWALGLLATVRGLQGDTATASALLEETAARYRSLGDATGLAWTRFAHGTDRPPAGERPPGGGALPAGAGHVPRGGGLRRHRRRPPGAGPRRAPAGRPPARLPPPAPERRPIPPPGRAAQPGHRAGRPGPGGAGAGRPGRPRGPATWRVWRWPSPSARRPRPPRRLEGLAALAAAEGQAEGAVRLLAAVDAIRPETAGAMPTSVLGRQERASCIDSLRARLGPPAFARAWRQGHQMPPATAIAGALQGAWEPDEVSPRAPSPGSPGAGRARRHPGGPRRPHRSPGRSAPASGRWPR